MDRTCAFFLYIDHTCGGLFIGCPGDPQAQAAPSQDVIDAARFVRWVDPMAGDDATGDGSELAPHATVAHGLAALRSARGTSTARPVLASWVVLKGALPNSAYV